VALQTLPASRSVSDTAVEMPQLVLPQHANVHGTVLGGMVLHWVDMAAALVANRHSRRPVVTAAFDEMSFLAPIQIGQLALLKARLTLVDRSSMEIRVDVHSEDLLTGERKTTGTAYVTFVALDRETKYPHRYRSWSCKRTRNERSTCRRSSAGGFAWRDEKRAAREPAAMATVRAGRRQSRGPPGAT